MFINLGKSFSILFSHCLGVFNFFLDGIALCALNFCSKIVLPGKVIFEIKNFAYPSKLFELMSGGSLLFVGLELGSGQSNKHRASPKLTWASDYVRNRSGWVWF